MFLGTKHFLLIVNLVIRTYHYVNGKDIFRCENRNGPPCMFQFKITIYERNGLEEIIAFNTNKIDQQIEKWQHLY